MGAAGAGAGGGGESRGELGGLAAGQLLEWLILSASCNKRIAKINCLEILRKTTEDYNQDIRLSWRDLKRIPLEKRQTFLSLDTAVRRRKE
jgi:hypothetical protein